ncbi:hypothetical protein SETIT_1G358600v2 [Setaria italica]|uniref:F-box protein AT5G49610-like beta-propeller domain-containing protein n=1 Tax=Setaria italica TaxID=4555 RepID=K3YSI3_SETIT|nr:uncharacterized protein LOC101776941 [Setaria italica]RCV08833.1 hypothetical protein SETIT_1G358600v2 [Setaria italica]
MLGKCRRPAPRDGDGDGDATAILDDADLEEILLRLPSAADLARSAALVCRRWRRVSSAPAFLRRFRRLHPPQILGFFICKGGRPHRYDVLNRSPLPVLDPTFLPVVAPNPGVGGAVGRCRDFSLSSLPTVDHWSLADSRDGLLLFCSSCDRSTNDRDLPDLRDIPKHFAVCDPLSGHSILLPKPGAGLYLGSYYLGAALVISDKDEGGTGIFSFEVLIATYVLREGPCLCAFSSSSRQWVVLPCPDTYELYNYETPWIDDGARDSGHVYWVVHDWGMDYEHILVLDLQTKKFSTINLPCSGMCDKYNRNIKVMRSEGDRDLRVVAMAWSRCALHFWRHDRSRSAKGRWLKEDVVKFSGVDGLLDLRMAGGSGNSYLIRIVDAGEGFVFIKHYEAPWVFVLNLKEMTMQKLPNRERFCGHALPYRMALSPHLPNFREGNH